MTGFNRRQLIGTGVAAAVLPAAAQAEASSQLWAFDNLSRIGGHTVRVEGAPRLIDSPYGKALLFDGQDDAVFIDNHPLAGAKTFTFEALFRPDGGAFEQRWFHLESDQSPPVEPGKGNTRIMFEIRVVEGQWYLDAFMKGPEYNKALIVEDKRFPVGRWYHVAQTYDGQVYRSYVDGEQQMKFVTPFSPQGPGKASAGVRMNRLNYFNGAIRGAKFTQAALMPEAFTRSF